MLREKLSECGWRDELKEHCKKVIREKGLEKVSIEELVAEITPKGRGNSQFSYRRAFTLTSLPSHHPRECEE